MRLGADPIKLHADTRARELYDEAVIYERHRHRYEVNLFLRKRLEAAGLSVSGTSPDERLVEVIELDDHPFFVASQYHPEFKSRPERPAPLFREFVGSAGERARRPADRAGERARSLAAVRRASAPRVGGERRRLNETFAALCAIASPSGSERACADAVIALPARDRPRRDRGRHERRDRRGLRQPPGPHPVAARGRADGPARRAYGHGRGGGADRAGSSRRGCGSTATSDPRCRQQGSRSRCWSSSRAGSRRGVAGRPGARVHDR